MMLKWGLFRWQILLMVTITLLNTSFNENGFSVRSNTNPSQMVGVGINAIKFSGDSNGKKYVNL